MIRLDHVLVMVDDLDDAGEEFRARYGLASLEGGRHTGLGTGNRIVPLGPDYVELMAVIDPEEASGSGLGRMVDDLVASSALGTLCLRTDDIDEVAARLGSQPLPMQRLRPDGGVLSWRLAGLEHTFEDPSLPFFIQWDVGPEDLPGATPLDHPARPTGLAWVELCGDPQKIQERIGADLNIRVTQDGDRGVSAFGIATEDGVLEIRQP